MIQFYLEMNVGARHFPNDTMVLQPRPAYMKCVICELRKPRRYCPGVRGDICSICCGNEREVTVDCPLDCPYLQEARAHEKYLPLDEKDLPNKDVPLNDAFLHSHEALITIVGFALAQGAAKTQPAVDQDFREALAALTQTYRTLSTGLYYESRPTNPYAASIADTVQEVLQKFREESKKDAVNVRDQEVLGVLVMFQRIVLNYNNGRPKGRAFVDLLFKQFKGRPETAREPSRLVEL